MKIDDNGIEMLKHIEGLSLKAYADPPGQTKTYSIGYGHLGVPAGSTCSPEQAEEYLREDSTHAQSVVNKTVLDFLTQGQFNALTSFIYNVGEGNFLKSTMLRLLRSHDITGAANEFQKWNKANQKVLPSLVNRRKLERAEFIGKGWRSVL
jgi:lysozyme